MIKSLKRRKTTTFFDHHTFLDPAAYKRHPTKMLSPLLLVLLDSMTSLHVCDKVALMSTPVGTERANKRLLPRVFTEMYGEL